MTVRVRPADRHYEQHAVWAPDGALHLTIALGAVPTRSPYQPGDWVQMHGYPAYPAGLRRSGFRGYVLGSRGSTLLYGLTDDGREWDEHWGHLTRDGHRDAVSARCVCCSPPLSGPRPPQQLDIWSVLDHLAP